jgi:uncharacterized damage-inducible protein DinB
MKKAAGIVLLAFSLFLVITRPAALQAQSQPVAPTSGFRADFLADWDDMAKKAVQLAEAMPGEKYAWHPEGARSVAEIYLHIASGNYFYPQAIGIKPPAGIDLRTLEKSTTEKAKVVEILKQSFEHARQAVLNTPDADLDKAITLFGQKSTARNLFYILGTHQHEHFGLTIAYARFNNVVPPWTAERQTRQAQQPPKKQN